MLDTLNGGGGFAEANGWRLPTLVEVETIVLDFQCTISPCHCPSNPCVDPALDASTTQSDFYWSATGLAGEPEAGWRVTFLSDFPYAGLKVEAAYVRAVRGGL